MSSVLVSAIISVLVEVALTRPATWIAKGLKSKRARNELAEVCSRAVEAAAQIFPEIREDVTSDSFIKFILLPMLEVTLEDPSQVPDAAALSKRYLEAFVDRFSGEGGPTDLPQLFRMDEGAVAPAFAAMLEALRSGLNASNFWRERAHHLTSEMTLSEVQALREAIDRLLPEEMETPDLEAARRDARDGSTELRNWPRSISGHCMQRPELKRLLDRIEAEQSGTSLLVGDAGSGKSALMAELTSALETSGKVVFAIKADMLPSSIEAIPDIGRALGLRGSLEAELATLTADAPIVVIIDQLDAVSRIMDRTSARMRVLLQLVRRLRDYDVPAHVVVSSRPFEAKHDARFQSLGAEVFELRLPSAEQVEELLQKAGIDSANVSADLRETLRRPFALKLFVDLVERGHDVRRLDPSLLLDQWLETADLGNASQRAGALDLLQKLSADMLDTETLWRPADAYESFNQEALARCEACGLLVRSDGQVGFSHQSWLDDFQAKTFRKGGEIAAYVWENQDGLFVRATLLRTLQRLRLRDASAYESALDLLLGDTRTRRHIRHLVVDIISSNPQPMPREAAWIETLIRTDTVLAARGVGKLVEHWAHWRGRLLQTLPLLMREEQLRWRAVQTLAAEALINPDAVVELLTRHWAEKESDDLAFAVLEQSGAITPALEALLTKILGRSTINPYSISHFVSRLREDGRLDEATRVVALWAAATKPGEEYSDLQLHDVSKLVDAAPLLMARALMPWFIAFASQKVTAPRPGFAIFPKSESLGWRWNFDDQPDTLVGAFRTATKRVAQDDPSSTMSLLDPLLCVEIDQVQEVVADAFAAGAANLSAEGFEFLMTDVRRLWVGEVSVDLEPGVTGHEAGFSSQELITAITPQLKTSALEQLRDHIEGWTIYGPGAADEESLEIRKARLRWSEQNRIALLDRLPPDILPARRRRQITEWRAKQPRPTRRTSLRTMAGWVGSPMSSQEMAKASDDAIMRMLTEVNDATPEGRFRRPISRGGGVNQLSQAFAAFGKSEPERAVALARTRLVPGKHEHAAASLVEELSKKPEKGSTEPQFPPETVLATILELSAKGFRSATWTLHASWALERLADSLGGLDDETVGLIASWLDNDPDRIAEQVQRRLDNDRRNEELNSGKKAERCDSILFRRLGGFGILPQDNFPKLSAISSGLLSRSEPDFEGWLGHLERHAALPEDAAVWTTLLQYDGRWLTRCDEAGVHTLLRKLWLSNADIFLLADFLPNLWGMRGVFPSDVIDEILRCSLASDDARLVQGAAEFVTAGHIVNPSDDLFRKLYGELSDQPSASLTGRLFAAAIAWREDDTALRATAQSELMPFVATAEGDQARALSEALDGTGRLPADPLTKQLLSSLVGNEAVLGESLNRRFAEGLQGLLLYPGFDETVLYVVESVAGHLIDEGPLNLRGLAADDFVQIAIALQRNEGEIRRRAMDVYETLLDANVYGADQAAQAATVR